MRAGSMPLRSTTAFTTIAARSSGRTAARAPPYRPIGVRSASTTTTSRIDGLFFGRLRVEHPERAAWAECRVFFGSQPLQDAAHAIAADLLPPFDRTARIIRSKTHRCIDVFGRGYLLLHCVHRLVDDRADYAPQKKPGAVFDQYDAASDAFEKILRQFQRVVRGFRRVDDLHGALLLERCENPVTNEAIGMLQAF